MDNKDRPAFPGEVGKISFQGSTHSSGLTKREYFAALMLQGIISGSKHPPGYLDDLQAKFAVRLSDALLAELEKK